MSRSNRGRPHLSAAEQRAMQEDGISFDGRAERPAHRLVDLPPGVIRAVVSEGRSFEDAMRQAARNFGEQQ